MTASELERLYLEKLDEYVVLPDMPAVLLKCKSDPHSFFCSLHMDIIRYLVPYVLDVQHTSNCIETLCSGIKHGPRVVCADNRTDIRIYNNGLMHNRHYNRHIHRTGVLMQITHFLNGIRHGTYTTFSNSKKVTNIHYAHGKQVGLAFSTTYMYFIHIDMYVETLASWSIDDDFIAQNDNYRLCCPNIGIGHFDNWPKTKLVPLIM